MQSQQNEALTQLYVKELFEIASQIKQFPSLPGNISSLFEKCVIDLKLCHLVVSAIINLTSIPERQTEALFYFKQLLTCISKVDTVDHLNLTFWLNSCNSPAKTDSNQIIRYEILFMLLEKYHKNAEFSKLYTSTYISKFFERNLVFSKDNAVSYYTLKCVEALLINYPGPCKPYRNKIEKVLLKYLGSVCPDVDTDQSAKCFHYLQQVGSGKMNGDCDFLHAQRQICSTISQLFNILFQPYTDISSSDDIKEEPLVVLDEILNESDDVKKMLNSTLLLTKCFKHLEIMMLEKFPLVKQFSVDAILNIISRGLEIQSNVVDENYSKCKIEFYNSCLIGVQISLLHLLRCLILCLGVHLLPFENTITELFVIVLKFTKSCTKQKLLCDLRIAAYKTLTNWIAMIKNNIQESSCDEFIRAILNDIIPERTEITLMISKKGANSNTKSSLQLRDENVKTISNLNEELCLEALKSLNMMFVEVNVHLKVSVNKQLNEAILKTLLNIQRGNEEYPYTNEKCQVELYRMLYSLLQHHNESIKIPLNTVANLCVRGMNQHKNAEISIICSHACNVLQKICQPVFPSLDIATVSKTANDSQQIANGDEIVCEETSTVMDLISSTITIQNVVSLNESDSQQTEETIELSPPEEIHLKMEVPSQNGSQVDLETNISQNSVENGLNEPPYKRMRGEIDNLFKNTADDDEINEYIMSFSDKTN